ncbi:MAG: sel1 repeat family protein [Mesorhizobium sp.]|nr:SEL1-like repeat protein [Mesorhizobium sp.]MCO5164441.1 sel1 repeat family protein [Mesorhizobium sp.]
MDRQVARQGLRRAGLGVAAAVFVAMAAAAPVWAGNTVEAQALLRAGDVASAVRLLEPLARTGDASAAYLLGKVHLDGLGVPQDFAAAAQWIAKAAESGEPRAQNALGRLHAEGLGVARDGKAALLWMQRAAEQGNPAHQYDLALLLDDGRLGVEDKAEAARWFAAAAEQGLAAAKTSLGLAYQQGTGVQKDLARAAGLFSEAAEAGDARAQNNLGLMLARGEGVPQDYERAMDLFGKAAAQGQTQAFYNLGVMYENGFGVAQDEARAMELYAKAGQSGGTSATDIVSAQAFLYDPRLLEIDPATAKPEEFAQGASRGDPVAIFLLAYLTATDTTLTDGPARAAPWFEKAADLGMPAAMANLGLLHLRGQGVPQDYVLGYMWLNLAAAAGLAEAAPIRDRVGAAMTPAELAEAGGLVEQKWLTGRR